MSFSKKGLWTNLQMKSIEFFPGQESVVAVVRTQQFLFRAQFNFTSITEKKPLHHS